MRPDWNKYFIQFAEHAAMRSSCLRRKVGCVIVRDNQVLSTGYNGPPSGVPECLDPRCAQCGGSGRELIGNPTFFTGLTRDCRPCNGTGLALSKLNVRHCLRIRNKILPGSDSSSNCRGVHAEVNAIIQAAKHGVSVKDAVLFCTHKPCFNCSKMIVNSGISKVFYKEDYPDQHEILTYLTFEKVQ